LLGNIDVDALKGKSLEWLKEHGAALTGKAKEWWDAKGRKIVMDAAKKIGNKLKSITVDQWFKDRGGMGMAEGDEDTCVVTMYSNTNKGGRSHSLTVSFPECEGGSKHEYGGKSACNYNAHRMGNDIGDDVESVMVSGGCELAMFVDDDWWSSKCKDTSSDNVIVDTSKGGKWQDLPTDLEDDVCRVVVVPK